MKSLSTYQKVLIWLAGRDVQTARRCTSSEVNSMEHIGFMVLIVPLIGLFNYTYAVNYYTDNLLIAIPIGVLISLVVMVIDRALVGYSRSKFTFAAVGRACLIIGFAFTLSEPILVGAFQSSIQEQLSQDVIQQQRQAATPYNRQINKLESEIDEGKERLHNLQRAYTEEMDGTGGSGIRRRGPIYRQKKQDYEEYKQSFAAEQESLQAETAKVDSARSVAIKQAKSNKADGLIAGVRALHDLGEKEPIVQWGSWIFRLVLIFVELCPLLIKMSSTGNIGLYYQLVDQFDEEHLEAIKSLKDVRIKTAKEQKALEMVSNFFEAKSEKIDRIAEGEMMSAELRLKHLTEMVETSKNHKKDVAKLINDEKLHAQIDGIFDEFIQTINDLGDDPSNSPLPEPQT